MPLLSERSLKMLQYPLNMIVIAMATFGQQKHS